MPTITLALNEQEQAAFTQILDVVLRQGGLGALDAVAHFKVKMDTATSNATVVAEFQPPQEPGPPAE